MKYLPLIWSGLWRKPGRTWLALIQIAVAFVLFGALQGFDASVKQALAATDADVLTVQSRGGNFDLPVSYAEKITKVKGVRAVSHETYFNATYQNSPQELFVVATEPESWAVMMTTRVNIPPGAVAALARNRTGALVGSTFMKRYGWKVGQRIHLQANVDRIEGTRDWAFDIVDVVETMDPAIRAEQSDFMIINYDYFDAARVEKKSRITQFFVKVNDARQAAAVADDIDRSFANSPDETRTQSNREAAQAQFQAIGDLGSITRSISAAVLFSLLFSISTLLMQGVRERTTELAVLKTLGFKDWAVVALLLCESLALCTSAAAVGLSAAEGILWIASGKIKVEAHLQLTAAVLVTGAALALTLAIVSSFLPAHRTLKLQISDALADR